MFWTTFTESQLFGFLPAVRRAQDGANGSFLFHCLLQRQPLPAEVATPHA